jgi:hypothetical protein
MIGEQWTWKHSEGDRYNGLARNIISNFPIGIEESRDNIGIPAEFRTEHLAKTSLER